MSQYDELKKYNNNLPYVHEDEFGFCTNKQNIEKKFFDPDKNIPSIDDFTSSVEMNYKYKLNFETFKGEYINVYTIKHYQSNYEFTKQIEPSEVTLEQNKISEVFQNKSTSSDTEIENNIKIENDTNNIFFKEKNKNEEKKNLGRKRKRDDEKGKHTKSTADNKIRKIKSHFTKFIYYYLNISDKNKKLLKMKKCINEDIKKQFNMDLMNMTLREMLIKYTKSKKGEIYISQLINEIFKYRVQEEKIKLNKTYIAVLKIMRDNHLDQFKAQILKEELDRGENKEKAINYVNELVIQLLNYENWFYDKKGRESKKAN